MFKSMNKDCLMELANNIISKDDSVKISTLSDEITISQVVKFFEKQGRNFTKTMIQNYVRVGVLPPPVEKRYYTHDHLVLLTLIDSLKSIFSLEEIRMVLAPIRNNPEIFDDDILKTSDIYTDYLSMRKQALAKWRDSLPELFDNVEKSIEVNMVKDGEKNTVSSFMIALTIMAQTIAMRDLINEIIKE